MNRFGRYVVLGLVLVLAVGAASAHTGKYPKMQVRLSWPTAEELQILRQVEDLDPVRIDPGNEIILVSTPPQVERLRELGFEPEIQIPDMEEYYASQRDGYRNFGLLYTYSEMVEQLDLLHSQYPEITTEKFSIGTSHEGRELWAMKVSDNPDVDEDEPEVLFDALHHAREPITVNVLVETIRYLCENYGTDPEVTFLVDNREIFFVPVINPDGYVYNEQNYPGGGGMWRKNRRPPTGGCWGVDPNRNYPYEWGGEGSSGDPCSEVYRGPSPASEPEVQALINFCNSHEFVTHDSYHSYSDLILIPWSYTMEHTEDDALFRQIGNGMSQYNGYTVGQPGELLYLCSGTTIDWTYGDTQQKPKIFSVTTEVGNTGFWPSDSEVPGLVAENVPANIYLIKIAGCYLTLASTELEGGDGDGLPDPGETLDLLVTVQNEGIIADAEGVALTLSSDDAYVQLHDASALVGDIPAGGEGNNQDDPLTFEVDDSCPAGHVLTLDLLVTAPGFEMTYEFSWLVGDLPTVFADDMESGQGDWTHYVVTPDFNDQWHMSTQRNHTPGGATSWKFGDTGAGDYTNLADGALQTLVIEVGRTVQLKFWHWMEAEESAAYPGKAYDGGLIEASINGGPWEQVTPEAGYTHTIREGSIPGPFPAGTPVFSGSFDWRQDVVSLEIGRGTIAFRFRFGSDGADTREGWYVDDIEIVASTTDNLPPSAPVLVSPLPGETVANPVPELVVENAVDPDPGSTLTYGFRVYSDELLTEVVASVDGIAEGQETTSWVVSPPLEDGTYYWRAYAFDGIDRGPFMQPGWFVVEAGGASAEVPTIAEVSSVLGASPLPAREATQIRLLLAKPGRVRATVYDLQGRAIRVLEGDLPAGLQSLRWDCTSSDGSRVGSGVYLYRVDGLERAGRIIVVR